MRVFLAWWLLCGLVAPVLADQAREIARMHVEAIGGQALLQKMTSLRVEGMVQVGGKVVRFTMLAQRPNRVRMEIRSGGKLRVQGYDGVHAPWQLDPATGLAREMTGVPAQRFEQDAEFDDPLVDYGRRGYSVDYAGETEFEGQPAFKLLVTYNLVQQYDLYVNRDTYLIIGKREKGGADIGGETTFETRYSDFAPVEEVVLPFRVEVWNDGRLTQTTALTRAVPNVPVPPGSFSPPAPRPAPKPATAAESTGPIKLELPDAPPALNDRATGQPSPAG